MAFFRSIAVPTALLIPTAVLIKLLGSLEVVTAWKRFLPNPTKVVAACSPGMIHSRYDCSIERICQPSCEGRKISLPFTTIHGDRLKG